MPDAILEGRKKLFFFFLPSSSEELMYKEGKVHLQRRKEDRRNPSRCRQDRATV